MSVGRGITVQKTKNNLVTFLIIGLLCMTLSLLAFSIQSFASELAEQSVIRVFLEQNINERQITEELSSVKGVIKTNFISKDEVKAEFEEGFGYSWSGTTPLPDLIDVTIVPAEARKVFQDIEGVKGIDYVAFQANAISNLALLTSVLSWLSGLSLFLAIFTFLIGSLVIRGRKLRCEF